jgi:hypothetical protein
MNIMVVSANRDFRLDICETVKSLVSSAGAQFTTCPDAESATDNFALVQPRIVCIDDSIPKGIHETAPVTGFELVQFLQDIGANSPSSSCHFIVLLDTPLPTASLPSLPESVTTLQKGSQLRAQLEKLFWRLSHSSPPRRRLVVNVRPRAGEKIWDVSYESWEDGVQFSQGNVEPIEVPDIAISNLYTLTDQIDKAFQPAGNHAHEPPSPSGNDSNWEQLHTLVGRNLAEIVFSRSIRAFLSGALPYNEDIAYRFIPSKDEATLAIEAIRNPDSDKYLFQDALIFRSYADAKPRCSSSLGPEHPSTPRILIVAADASGYSDVLEADFTDIGTSIRNEYEELRALFQDTLDVDFHDGEEPLADQSVCLTQSNYSQYHRLSMKDALVRLLSDHTWDIVHFSGHSAVRTGPSRNSAYLLVPGNDAQAESVSFQQLADEARSVRLFFLNSCQSGSHHFGLDLNDSNIHKLIGYRWRINDDDAIAFAREFYTSYLHHKDSVPAAYVKARRRILEDRPASPAWAAPVLCVSNLGGQSLATLN